MSRDRCRVCEANERERWTWGKGPWEREPNLREFEHAGLSCFVHRGGFGAWCGYVGVPKGHALWGANHSELDHVDAHCGLNYSNCDNPHEWKPGTWWFGFDCGHAGDVVPGMAAQMRQTCIDYDELFGDDHYWTMDEVIAETKRLAEQLSKEAL